MLFAALPISRPVPLRAATPLESSLTIEFRVANRRDSPSLKFHCLSEGNFAVERGRSACKSLSALYGISLWRGACPGRVVGSPSYGFPLFPRCFAEFRRIKAFAPARQSLFPRIDSPLGTSSNFRNGLRADSKQEKGTLEQLAACQVRMISVYEKDRTVLPVGTQEDTPCQESGAKSTIKSTKKSLASSRNPYLSDPPWRLLKVD